MWVEFRKVSAITMDDLYPLPHIKDLGNGIEKVSSIQKGTTRSHLLKTAMKRQLLLHHTGNNSI